MTTTTTGPDFISFQVRDKEASASFYEQVVGLTRLPATNPAAVAFAPAGGAAFAVRDPFPGVDLEAIGRLGAGIGVWMRNEDTVGVHARVVEAGALIVQDLNEGPFGTQFAFSDPDGYVVTIHSK